MTITNRKDTTGPVAAPGPPPSRVTLVHRERAQTMRVTVSAKSDSRALVVRVPLVGDCQIDRKTGRGIQDLAKWQLVPEGEDAEAFGRRLRTTSTAKKRSPSRRKALAGDPRQLELVR